MKITYWLEVVQLSRLVYLRVDDRSGIGLGLERLLTCLLREAWVGRVGGWRVGDEDPGWRRTGDLLRLDSNARSNFLASCSSRIGSTSNLPTTAIILDYVFYCGHSARYKFYVCMYVHG